MKKKILALLLASLLLFGAMIPAYCANAQTTDNKLVFIDDLIGACNEGINENEVGVKEVEMLRGLIPDLPSYEDMEQSISRRDFLIMLTKLMVGNGFVDYIGFADIDDKDIDLLEAIGYAVSTNIISRTTSFRPDDSLKMSEMVKMGVCALGYDIMAQRSGGWPMGYFATAIRINLIESSGSLDKEVKIQEAYRFLYSLMAIDKMDIESYGDVSYFNVIPESNVLESRFGVKLVEGIVSSNDVTGLTNRENKVTADHIKIGRKVLKNNIGTDYLGYNVRAYWRDNNGIDEIISIQPKNTEKIFLSEFDMNGLFVSDLNEKGNKKYELYSGYSLIVNDVAEPYESLSKYKNRNDVTIHLLDNNNDNKYDVVKVYCWETLHIGKVNSIKMTIKDKNPGYDMIDLSDEECEYEIYSCADGCVSEITFDELEADDVLSYYVIDGKNYIIFRSQNALSSKIEAKDTDNNLIFINGEGYYISQYLKNNIYEISMGKDSTIYFDAMGNVSAISGEGRRYLYGWIISSGTNDSFDEVGKIKMFSQNGNISIFEVNDKLFIDGEKSSWNDFSVLEPTLGDNRLVRFSLDDEERIKYIDFPTEYSGEMPFADKFDEDNSFTYYYDGSWRPRYTGIFGDMFKANDTTSIFFSIPTETKRDDDTLYRIKSLSDYTSSYHTFKVYDFNEDGCPKILLNFSNKKVSDISVYSQGQVVLSVMNGHDEDDNDCYVVETYDGLTYNKYYSNADTHNAVGALKKGDIALFSLEGNKIYSASKFYDCGSSTVMMDGSIFNEEAERSGISTGYIYNVGADYINALMLPVLTEDTRIRFSDIKTFDFSDSNFVFVDVYRDNNGKILDVEAKYEPISEANDYLTSGLDANRIVYHKADYVKFGAWIYREIYQ